ncbi:MAG: aquaporin [Phycisphaeraceae bacterium]|nr:aquaporin [Phycisphaeraceae bacterium]
MTEMLLHWKAYCIEASLLGAFMFTACAAVVLFHHPGSPVTGAINSDFRKRLAIGVLMGLTAIALIYSPLGQLSGAHMNPGTTLTFFLLGKVEPSDAACYICFQALGGIIGVAAARLLFSHHVAHEHVRYASTLPGKHGLAVAFAAEFIISCMLMTVVLWTSNFTRTAAYTGIFAGILVASFIAIEAPLSGMSMNPARTLASAVWSREYRGLWLYFTAPPLGMLLAAGVYVALRGTDAVYCAKLHHPHEGICIFHCNIDRMPGWTATPH